MAPANDFRLTLKGKKGLTARAFLPIVAALSFPSASQSQEVADCDWRSSAAAIIEPWDTYSRSFANGDVRIAVLDAIEPGLAPLHLLVLSPPFDELGARQCKIVTLKGTRGFADMNFEALDASYDPAVGLIFTLPVRIFENDAMVDIPLRFTLNQATGQMDAQFVR